LSGFSPIRVFLVDDSPVALLLIKRLLATSPDIEVVGTARNGREALEKFAAARPKVICTDLSMPVMGGLELIQEAMATYPRPILVISSAKNAADRDKAYELLAAGAVDVFPKPTANDAFEETARQLVQKIRILSGVYVFARSPQEPGLLRVRTSGSETANLLIATLPIAKPNVAATATASATTASATTAPAPTSAAPVAASPRVAVQGRIQPPRSSFYLQKSARIRLVALGSSTGGPQVLESVLSRLPASFPCPILCVQHISKGFLDGLVDWLRGQCSLNIRIAQPGEVATPGVVYFPQEDTHLEIDVRGRLSCLPGPLFDGHRPSVSVTFASVARSFGNESLAVLMTGMGSDGASGLKAILASGGVTIAQDEASCVVFGMPKQAIEIGAAQYALSPDGIVEALRQVMG